MCKECCVRCLDYDKRCPLCRTPSSKKPADLIRRLQKHADEGNVEAQTILGNFYLHGQQGPEKDPERAVPWYELAAAQGDAGAQCTLAYCYESGTGVNIDLEASARWYRRAADRGLPDAQFNLGTILYHGKGVAQSNEEALHWLCLAAAQGQPTALFTLGACYANGRVVPQDVDRALRLLKRAAAKGHAEAAAAMETILRHHPAARALSIERSP